MSLERCLCGLLPNITVGEGGEAHRTYAPREKYYKLSVECPRCMIFVQFERDEIVSDCLRWAAMKWKDKLESVREEIQ